MFVSTLHLLHAWGHTRQRPQGHDQEEPYFPEANEKGHLGLFPNQVRRRCSHSDLNENKIPPSDSKCPFYRQNFKGGKKEVCLVGEKKKKSLTARYCNIYVIFPLVQLVCKDLADPDKRRWQNKCLYRRPTRRFKDF